MRTDSVIPPHYDSLMAKLIVTGATRAQALRRAKVALDEMVIAGVPSVLPFHRAVVRNADFANNERYGVYTTWIESEFAEALASSPEIAAAEPGSARETLTIEVDGKAMNIGLPASLVDSIRHGGTGAAFDLAAENIAAAADESTLAAPMNGNLVKWAVEEGAVVAEGDTVAVLEAMKMESAIAAHRAGTFTRGAQEPGTAITRGEALGTIA